MDLQALVLTHEGASDTEKFPYLSVMLKPLQVLEFLWPLRHPRSTVPEVRGGVPLVEGSRPISKHIFAIAWLHAPRSQQG